MSAAKAPAPAGDATTAGMAAARVAHATPAWNAADEPWIPVQRAAASPVELASVRDVLTDAHRMHDIAEPDPLACSAIRRLLEDVTAALIVATPAVTESAWRERAEQNTGFPAGEVDAFLASIHDRLYAYHPTHPFLQDIRLAGPVPAGRRGTPDTGFAALLPHLPGDSEAAWWFKPTDPAMRAGLTIPEAVRALATRRAYGLPGNGGGGDRGGTYAEGPATVTHVFRVSPGSLFRTLLRNLTPGMLATPADGQPSGLAWLEPGYRAGGNALYLSSVTVTQALLGPVDPTGRIHAVLRGSLGAPVDDKAARNEARDADRHAITRTLAAGPKRCRIDPAEHPVKRLHGLMSVGTGTDPVSGVLLDGNLWLDGLVHGTGDLAAEQETLELLLASKAGQASSPKFKHVESMRIPALRLAPGWAQRPVLAAVLAGAFAATLPALRRAMRNALDSDARTPDAVNAWMDQMALLVTDAIRGSASVAEAARGPARAALRSFDIATEPLAGQSSTAPRIAAARRPLINAAYPKKGAK